jgi:hypothetical protein
MRPQIFGQSADILTTAGTVRERRRPYKLGGLSAQVTWGLHEREATSPERELFLPDLEEVRSWRFCRVQIVSRRGAWSPIFWWTHSFGAYILIGAEILTSALFLSYIMWRSNFTIPHSFAGYICRLHLPATFAAYILPPMFAAYICRLYLQPIFAAYICRLYFGNPPTFWASANILCMCEYFRQVPIFWWFFAMSFCLIFVAASICIYFQYLFRHFYVRQYFWRNCFEA